MALSRPIVSVYSHINEGEIVDMVRLPSVFITPIRPDLVRFVHTNMAKNKRQAHGVSPKAGYQTSAESWGTGRAVSRIPRVPGGGTHRAGQAAFGNMCRGGGMFAPNKTWRRWHRKINHTQKRHAVATAIAASAIPALVMARGHRIDNIPHLPLVVTDDIQKISRTKHAVEMLKKLGCEEEMQKVRDSRKLRAGKGKMRNRRHVQRLGPLIVFEEDNGISRAFRNIPGVELCHVSRLNLLTLAPGGTLGRLIVWSSSACRYLNGLYGSVLGDDVSPMKKNYHLPRPIMANADVARIINSDEIQSVVRPIRKQPPRIGRLLNPLRNRAFMQRINPAKKHLTQLAKLERIPGTKQHELVQHRKRKREDEGSKSIAKKRSKLFFQEIVKAFSDKAKENMAKNITGSSLTIEKVEEENTKA